MIIMYYYMDSTAASAAMNMPVNSLKLKVIKSGENKNRNNNSDIDLEIL